MSSTDNIDPTPTSDIQMSSTDYINPSAPHANDQTRNDIDESSFSSLEDSASEASGGHSSPTTSPSLRLELRRVDHYLKATELRV